MPKAPSMRLSSQPSGTITATATTEPGSPYPIVAVRAAPAASLERLDRAP